MKQLFSLFLFFNLAALQAQQSKPLPNIVIFFIDDLAYSDIGSFGAKGYNTPNLDKLASEGIKLTNFYVAQPVCSASRTALLTGCYPNRLSIHNALMPDSKIGLNPAETTIADMLKTKGYATALFGKWHIGNAPEFMPLRQGFDTYFGIPYSNDMWLRHPNPSMSKIWGALPVYEGDSIVAKLDKEQNLLTTQITEHAVNFVEQHKNEPFFMLVTHPQPHVPLFVSDKYKGKSERGLFGDVIMELDWSVGEVWKALKDNGLDENTLIIFTSDNGPWLAYGDHAGIAKPLREGKGSVWEGGVRVPFLARWKGKLPAGKTIHTPAMTIDILPTIAHWVDVPLPPLKIDGKNIAPILEGKRKAKSPHEAYFFYYRVNELQAVRKGKWKYYLPHSYVSLINNQGGTDGKPAPTQDIKLTEPELYDLDNDISETHNVIAKHPKIVKAIEKDIEKMRQELGDSLTKRKGNEVRAPGKID